MIRYLSAQKVEIDIHEMKREQAKKYLERFLSAANSNVREVTVIHGFSGGTVLRDMVQKGLKHHRIRAKIRSLNPGVTILELN